MITDVARWALARIAAIQLLPPGHTRLRLGATALALAAPLGAAATAAAAVSQPPALAHHTAAAPALVLTDQAAQHQALNHVAARVARAEHIKLLRHQRAVRRARRRAAARAAAAAAAAQAAAQQAAQTGQVPPSPAPAPQPPSPPAAPVAAGAPGSFEQCVITAESGGNPHAVNPTSGAGGLYGFLPSTWQALGHSGLPENASVAEQQQAFQQEYAQSGTSAWAPYDGC